MPKAFEGTVRVRLDTETARVFLARGVKSSTLTAADADQITKIALDAAIANKARLDRWSFYVRDENEKLGKDPKATLDPKVAIKALKAGWKARLVVASYYGAPAIWIEAENAERVAKVSKFTDLA